MARTKAFLYYTWPLWVALGAFLLVHLQLKYRSAEAFTLTDMGNHHQVDASDFHGSVLYVDVWASWCVPCRESMPHAQALADRYADRGLAVIGVNEDTDSLAAYQFLNHLNIDFQQLSDAQGSFMQAFAIDALPTVLIFDRTGELRHRFVGYNPAERDRIDQALLALLAAE